MSKKINYPRIVHHDFCRFCKSEDLYKFLDLGFQPNANSFLRKEQLEEPENFYPLVVYFCKNCGLVQLLDVVSKEDLFRNYSYVSSVSSVLVNHFSEEVDEVVSRFISKDGELCVEIGSNDGVLLQAFKKYPKVRILGIEPASNVAEIARKKGIPTIDGFFTNQLAQKIFLEHGPAKVILANNVMAHIDDMDEIYKGVSTLLSDDGVFIYEVHYLLDLINKNEFDTIYHEHFCYYSLKPAIKFANKYGFDIFDIKRIPIHGGSIRVYLRKIDGQRQNRLPEYVKELIRLEEESGLYAVGAFIRLSEGALGVKKELINLLKKLKTEGKRIVAYTAPAKGNTLLNFCGIDTEYIDYIVEDSPLKQGLFTPGTHIPIYSQERLKGDVPDYMIILSWTIADVLMKKMEGFKKSGGRFIIPAPELKII